MTTFLRRLEDQLTALAVADLRAATWVACGAARSVLPLIPEGEDRPRRAIEATEAWIHGRGSTFQRDRSSQAMTDIQVADPSSAVFACLAAMRACRPDPDNPRFAYLAAVSASTAAGYDAADDHDDPAFAAAMAAHAEDVLERTATLAWPRVIPSAVAVTRAPEGVRVAWDRVAAAPEATHTIPALIAAHARAGRLGLDWGDPVQRAVAEGGDEAWLRPLLRPQA